VTTPPGINFDPARRMSEVYEYNARERPQNQPPRNLVVCFYSEDHVDDPLLFRTGSILVGGGRLKPGSHRRPALGM
jgi:hypothetical protein